MKRLHVSVATQNIEESVRFYSTLFGAEPTMRRDGYAKWMLDDPRVNFVLDTRCGRADGVDHLGIQVDTDEELREATGRLAAAEVPIFEQQDTTCCYHRSDKTWSADPHGVRWETFRTMGETTVYGEPSEPSAPAADADAEACCARAT